MSKTSQLNKIAKEESKKARKASDEVVETKVTEVNPEEVKVEEVAETSEVETSTVKKSHIRGKKYLAAKKMVDVNRFYPLEEASKLVLELSTSKFVGKVEAHVTVAEAGNIGEISFPHLETASKKIVILNDTVLAEIKEGKIDFDILIATPVTMPKLLPFARVLGPRGLMPNPKNGTLTDKPEESVKRLSVAKTAVKTEKKSPVVHIIVGKTNQPASEIAANVAELIKIIKAQKIKKLVLCPTMGPSVKVEVIK